MWTTSDILAELTRRGFTEVEPGWSGLEPRMVFGILTAILALKAQMAAMCFDYVESARQRDRFDEMLAFWREACPGSG